MLYMRMDEAIFFYAKIMMGALKIIAGLHGLAQKLLIRKAWQSLNFQGVWSAFIKFDDVDICEYICNYINRT